LPDARTGIVIDIRRLQVMGRVRTTVALSADLLEAVDTAVQEGKADSRNEFLEVALRHELALARL
jgi:metal-responsive CopG/Arc/MetJ family transcriptional regulator